MSEHVFNASVFVLAVAVSVLLVDSVIVLVALW